MASYGILLSFTMRMYYKYMILKDKVVNIYKYIFIYTIDTRETLETLEGKKMCRNYVKKHMDTLYKPSTEVDKKREYSVVSCRKYNKEMEDAIQEQQDSLSSSECSEHPSACSSL